MANMIVNDFSSPEALQDITIRAIPQLQLGDLVSWQGRHWRVFGIKSKLEPSAGFVQGVDGLLIDTTNSYFRIGMLSLGGADLIAP